MRSFLLLSTAFLIGVCYCAPSNSKGNGGNATQNSREANSTSQVQQAAQPIPQEKQTVPDTNSGVPKPVLQHNHFTKELAVPITLDLAEVNTNSVDVPDTTTKDGINTTYYYPKGKFYFEKIVDGTRTVWESTKEKCSPAYTISKGDITFLALLLKKSDDETDLIYYEKKNLGWKLVEKTKSENIIEELKRQPEQPAVKTIDLDLSDVDSITFSVEESEEDKVPIKKYAVKTDHHLNEINNGDSELWKSDSPNKHCTLATVYFEEENPMLASLSLNQGFVYLQNKDGKWVGVSKDGYDAALTNMKARASLPKIENVELDVTDMSEEEPVEEIPLNTATPTEGHHSSVMEDGVEVWKGTHTEQEGQADTVRADTPSNSSSLDLSKEPNEDLFTFRETIDNDVKYSKYKLKNREDKVTTIIHDENVLWKAKTNESL
ncbi:signal peptide-containing protein [Theileria equi strain WA]|uniref:Signal peptide-containing protein n=1 Tax=Theileria equi strain WA TaxID=1537102 RepID=L0AXM4_THEEQ|nr:signal peptide-containing protein [Theileria equi strain WA]AFZ79771.1 signal peptide-containing protein [Theileria equi strain WA]|eukprot:XP_004829437.1 signal peptide-containing protein [Theileria equi strain WA]